MKKKFKRILLKLSGEGLMGDQPFGIDENVLNTVSESIRNIRNTGLELCIVIGGGNFYRGVNNTNEIIRRPVADQAGMLATVINALFLKSALNSKGIRAEILSGLSVPQIAETYSYRAAQQMLADGYFCRRNRESVFHHRYRSNIARSGSRMRRIIQSHSS